MKYIKTYEENNNLKKYILIHGRNKDFGNSEFTVIYQVDKYTSYGIEASILYYLQNNKIQKNISNTETVLNKSQLNNEIVYQSDNLEDILEYMKIYIISNKYNL